MKNLKNWILFSITKTECIFSLVISVSQISSDNVKNATNRQFDRLQTIKGEGIKPEDMSK